MPRRHRLLYGFMLLMALLMTGLFTTRAVHRFSEMRSGGGAQIRPWMSVPYIARTYGVPTQLLFDTLRIPPEKGRPRPIGVIARAQHRPVGQVIYELRRAIDNYYGPPLPPVPTPPVTPVLPITPVPPLSNS
jgi:hypothetical protein